MGGGDTDRGCVRARRVSSGVCSCVCVVYKGWRALAHHISEEGEKSKPSTTLVVRSPVPTLAHAPQIYACPRARTHSMVEKEEVEEEAERPGKRRMHGIKNRAGPVPQDCFDSRIQESLLE